VQGGALWAFVPVLLTIPFSLLALLVFWFPLRLAFGLPYWWFVAGFLAGGLLLFVRPFQVFVLTPVLGARHASAEEAHVIEPLWDAIGEVNNLPASRYVVRVVDSDEVNAFACGGHLVVVTSFAVSELTGRQLRGVLAHELSHHLGLHTVALTIGHWLSVPVVLLARIGYYLENVATAAANSFGKGSPVVAAIGAVAASLFSALAWLFTAVIRASDAVNNLVGYTSEYEADQLAVRMGFGPELVSALRYVLAQGQGQRPIGWRARLATSHPPALTRVARIEALMRHPAA
jgi:Zn-dependent protease with chaperone function